MTENMVHEICLTVWRIAELSAFCGPIIWVVKTRGDKGE